MTIKNYYSLAPEFINTYLSYREAQCLAFLMIGYTNNEVEQLLNLSERTIEAYVVSMRLKCNTISKNDLIKKMVKTGFIELIPEIVEATQNEASLI